VEVGVNALLVVVLAVPLAGAAVLAVWRGGDRGAKALGVAVAAVAFVASVLLAVDRAGSRPGRPVNPWHDLNARWVPALGLRFHLGVDGISYPLVVLTTLLVLACTVYTLYTVPDPGRPASLLALVFVLEVGMVGTFLALDLLLFFVFFELVLAPMYFLIAGWGHQPGARHAAVKFILYTLLGSVLLVVGLLTVYAHAHTLDIPTLTARHGAGLGHGTQVAAFLAIAAGFAVKSPLFPLHTWLPDAHTEAPTVGSVLLAGVLLKMGTYGLIRIGLPVLPDGARTLAPALAVLAVVGIFWGGLCCLAQTHLKRLIAYSSVGHMGFVLLGIATLTRTGIQAALIGNVAHGLVTSLLFFLAGALYERRHSFELGEYGHGATTRVPRLGGLLVFAAVASLGLPGLAGFWGELFAVFAAFRPAGALPHGLYTVLGTAAAFGAALAAMYFLRLLWYVAHGEPRPPAWPSTVDAGRLELLAWSPLVLGALALGLWPRLVLDLTDGPVRALVGVLS
jgi:NADH-quinone oxidoreductase subunit M